MVCAVAADHKEVVIGARALREHWGDGALGAHRLQDHVLGHAHSLFSRDLASRKHACDLCLVLGELLEGPATHAIRAAVANMAHQVAATAGDGGRERGAQAHAHRRSVRIDEVVQRLEKRAPNRLDRVEVECAGIGGHPLHEHGQLAVEPLGEAVDHGGACQIPRRKAAHAIAHQGHGHFAKRGLCNLDAAGVLIDLFPGTHVCGGGHVRHRFSSCRDIKIHI